MELHCIYQRTQLFSLFVNPEETALCIQRFHFMFNVKHGSWGEAKAVMLQVLFTFFFIWNLNTILSNNPFGKQPVCCMEILWSVAKSPLGSPEQNENSTFINYGLEDSNLCHLDT